MVSKRVTQRCAAVVAPVLLPGEQIQMIDVLQLGKVSAKRQIATAAVAGIVSGGLLMVSVKPRLYLVVVTDRRIMFVDYGHTNVGKTVAFAVGHADYTIEPLRAGLLRYSTDIHIADPAVSYRLSWGRAQGKLAKRVAAAIAASSTVPAGR